MGSKTKSTYIEDRISELPDEILCRILSFLNTKEAVKTSILSHRWNNVWAFVPNLDFSVCSPKMVSDRCVRFVDRVLSSRGSSNIHRLRLGCADIEDYFSRIESWICSAIARKVVELDLCLDSNSSQYYELPTSLFMCNTLEVLKLQIKSNLVITKPPPTSKCFPSLKFLHVTLYDPNSDSFGYLFSCCPALEDLIIDGNLRRKPVSHFNISAPKLKRLRICLRGTLMDSNCINGSHASRIYVDAPNLETLYLEENFMAAYFLKNKDCLRRAKIYLRVLSINNVVLDHADHLCKLFAGIVNVGNLSFSAPILEVPEIMDRCHVPTLHNLNHLKLHLQTCCSWKSLTKWLNISPNLEHLVFTKNNYYCVWKDKERYHELEHDQWRPELVPICLLSRLKTICIRGFWGWPHEMEVIKYLLKHGEVLNNLTIVYTTGLCVEELQQELSKLPRGSKTCQVMAGSSRHYLQCLCS